MVEPPAGPTVAVLEAALTQMLLESDGLQKVRPGALREQVAQRLGLPRDGVGGRSDEVRSTAAHIVESLDDWWEPESLDCRQWVYLVTFAILASLLSSLPG